MLVRLDGNRQGSYLFANPHFLHRLLPRLIDQPLKINLNLLQILCQPFLPFNRKLARSTISNLRPLRPKILFRFFDYLLPYRLKLL